MGSKTKTVRIMTRKLLKLFLFLISPIIIFSALSFSNYDDSKSDLLHDSKNNISLISIGNNTSLKFIGSDLSEEFISNIRKSNEQFLAHAINILQIDSELPDVNVIIYSSLEEKGLATKKTFLSHADFESNSVHTVVNNWIDGNDFTKNALLLIENKFPNLSSTFLKSGLSIYIAENWRHKDYKYWAARIHLSGNTPPLNELLNNEILPYRSELIYEPLAGSFFEFLNSTLSIEEIIALSTKQLLSYENDWIKYLNELTDKYSEQINYDRNNFIQPNPGFKKGFCFAHEGYDIYNGYISQEAKRALEKLASINVNSVSITPFTSMRNPNKPIPLSIWKGAGTENDESVMFSNHQAQKLGMTTILKPHIYLHGSWPGAIEMSSENEWNQFHEYYYNWIIHFAMLAELYNFPIFVIGNELSKSTLGYEDYWIKLAKKIRGIYSGKITYGANWGNEFESLNFWDHFDYIGVSQYYPLSKKPDATDDELRQGAEEMIRKVEEVHKRFDKPILFTEIGFRNSEHSWMTSYEKGDTRKKINDESQVRAYKAVLKASYGKDWLHGIYIWKWPTYMDYGKNQRFDLYTPNKKPAERVVMEWYAKDW